MTRQGPSAGRAEVPLIGIVDDDEPVRDSISSLVRSAGFRAAVFPSAEEFLNSDHVHDMKCLILDIRMPGLSGLDLQRQLRGMKDSIPVMIATAHAEDEVRTRVLDQGALLFCSKPFGDEALFAALYSTMSRCKTWLVRRRVRIYVPRANEL